jgi:hypothetical protein
MDASSERGTDPVPVGRVANANPAGSRASCPDVAAHGTTSRAHLTTGRGLNDRSCRAFQNQFQTSLMSQLRNVATAKGGIKYHTQVPWLLRLAMFAPFPL